MEPVGLGIGIAGLAGIFSTCLDMIERIDSYRDFRVDSRAIISQFDADILLFKQWGKSVGYDGKTLEDDHHENLNDAETFSAIRKIFEIIQDIAEDLTEGSSSQQDGAESTISRGKLNDSRRRQFQKLRGFASHRTKIEWILRHKARFLALSQQFGSLVGSLRALVPPETSRSVDSVGGQLHQADPSSHNDVMSKPIRGVNASSPHLDFQRLCMEIEKQFERHMKKDLDDWLGASFTNATYSDSVEKRLPDTCNWILDRGVFVDWESANFASTRAKVLWINGPAGYGKTVLSARIVQHLKARDNLILAHFFFSADLENRADPFIVIRSWASQIISQNREAFDIACGKLEVQNGQPASSTEVMGLFKEIVQQVPNCICVVDALDECSSKGNWSTVQSNTMESFIRLTMQAISGTSSQVLMVSRDDQEIRKGLAQSNTKNAGFEVFEYKIDPADVKPDASKLACSIVDEKLHKKSTALKAEIAERIVDRCDSMFLRIKLLENDIRSGKNQKQLERIVDQAPAALGDLYDRNWARIMGRSNDQDRALAILRWITFGLRPITVFEMTEALLLTGFEDVDDFENELPDEVDESYIQTEILELCESLVETRAGNSTDVLGLKTLHLTHFTVRQYVLLHLPTNASQLIANGNLTSSNELFQHNILAEACLRYLSISSLW
ncbi:prion-inhibition and propagation-domain-containing protein, partial [Truncatella angustata]